MRETHPFQNGEIINSYSFLHFGVLLEINSPNTAIHFTPELNFKQLNMY